VDQIQKDLITLTDKASGLQDLIKVSVLLIFVESNNAAELVKTAAENIEKLLANRSEALKLIKTGFIFNLDSFAQINITSLEKEQEKEEEKRNRFIPDDFEIDPDFKRLVSYNTTAVHIPTDIYEGSTIILNELNWTDALEDVFRKNKEDDPSLLWQVFGSATGLARYYPASPWIDKRNSPDKIDLYDVRRKSHFMCCRSGSVSGLTLKLIKTSVSKMLETLSDDDFVNVVSFNKNATPVACFKNLVQANVRNKRMLKEAVQGLKAEGITNYTSGFELAFEQLAQTNVSRANCNKIIMLFTDGGEEKAEEIFKKYNPKQEVRIFTFSVGQHSYDKGPIQWMACNNKGYYYEIPSIGAIRLNTQEYLDVLGRPMVKADSRSKRDKKAKQVQWTNVYLDALVFTLSAADILSVFPMLFSQKSQNQLILGVMAIDVSLEDIKRLTPRFTFGPNGYYFAIDPNGYVLLHPNLQPLFDEPVTLDFLDAELENDFKVEIRSKMIDGERGNYSIATLVKSQDERYIDQGQRTYTFGPVKGTDYSLALVLPDYSVHYIRATIGDTITQAKCKLPFTVAFAVFAVWQCSWFKYFKITSKCQASIKHSPGFCYYVLIAVFSLPVRHGVIARFVATDGGITRVFPKSAGLDWTEEAETYESSFYKRSLDNDVYIFTPTPCNGKPPTNIRYTVPHTGISFINITYRMNVSRCLSYIDCVVLDDGGFLVMSNQENHVTQIGCFFGVIDPDLMRTLVNSSLFTSKSTYDYQSLCEPKRESKAAAGLRSIYVPTIADMLNMGWWFIFSNMDSNLKMLSNHPTAEMDDKMSDAMSKEVCITEQTQYFFENDESSFGGSFECANFTRQYLAEKVPNTNLVFIISDRQPDSQSSCFGKLRQDEQQSNGPNPCEMALRPRYRKGPAVCFDKTEHEEDPDCGGVSSLSPSLWLMVAIQAVLLWVVTDSRHHAISS
uniref:Calcium channel, voltage-dependent, alpha 2/delta subunit 1a n=1 Tax=Fundulus heteroclitus TaxID=8078 RepID=A0A3Q2Q9Q3_FUNHE